MAYNNTKEKLRKVGMEGFAMVDECYGRKATRLNTPQRPPLPPPQQFLCRYQYQPQESHVYVVTQFSSTTKVASASLDSYEATNIYGGTLIADYPKSSPTKVASASLDSYEAANIYGGTLIVDYPKRKPTHVAYY